MIERRLRNIERELLAQTSGQAPSKEQVAGYSATIMVQNAAPIYFQAEITLTFSDGVKWFNISNPDEFIGMSDINRIGNTVRIRTSDLTSRQEPYEITAVSFAPFVMVQSG